MKSYKSFLNERRTIQVKRKYGQYAPTIVGANAPVRQKILGFISEKGSCCKSDLMEFIKSTNEDSGRKTTPDWVKANSRYFETFEKDGETHYKLSKLGQRVVKLTKVNEGTTPTYKALIRRAKVLGIETFSELEDLIADEFGDSSPEITGADYETARKQLKLTESKSSYNIDDFTEGAIITFDDGEEWKVVKPGMRGSRERVKSNEITIYPHNDIAKKSNISKNIDVSLDYLNSHAVDIKK